MGSGKKGGGKMQGTYPGSVDNNLMMIQSLGEMNLDACDYGEWLMINNKNGVRAKNHPQVWANQPPKAWAQHGMLNQAQISMGQPTMLGRPQIHEHGFVPRPPNFVSSNKHDVMMRNPVGPPSWSNGHVGQGFDARGGYDGNGINSNGGSKRPIVVYSDDHHDDDDDDVEEDKKGYSSSKAKNPTQSKAPKKGVHQNLTTNSKYPGVGPRPYSHPGVGYHGWRPIGGGVMPMPPAQFPPPPPPPPPPFLLPPMRSVANFPSGDKKRNSDRMSENFSEKVTFDGEDGTNFDDEFDDEVDDDLESEEDEDTHKRGLYQNGRHVRGQVNLDPRLGMPPQLKNSWNLAHGGCGSHVNGKKSVVFHGDAKEDPQHRVLSEHYRQRYSNSGSIGATSCKTRAKNAKKDVQILSDLDSTDIEGDGESEFNNNPNDEMVARSKFITGKSEKFGKHVDKKYAIKQVQKDVKQSYKKHLKQCGEDTDVCIGVQLQMKAVSFLEDYKNGVKEVAKLVKLHITPKPEIDTYTSEKEWLMKINGEKLKMKKRHQEEEQELEKQFSVALKRFMDKQTTINADSDASSEL